MLRTRLLSMATLLAAFVAFAPIMATAAEPVSPQTLSALLERGGEPGLLVLDVRTQEEFAQGHVPGAVLIPHDQLDVRLPELAGARRIVVYCRSGRRSGIAEDLLRKRGYEVEQLQGSWQAWEAAGLPTETAKDTTP